MCTAMSPFTFPPSMPRFLLTLVFVLFSSPPFLSAAQDGDESQGFYEENPSLPTVRAEAVPDSMLADLLAMGEKKDLTEHSSYEQIFTPIVARLYSIPGDSGSCIPETHGACTSHYVLAVMNYNLPIATAAYYLGDIGELARFRWLKSKHYHQAHLEFVARRYPKWAVEDNPALLDGQQKRRYKIWVSPDSIRIQPIR